MERQFFQFTVVLSIGLALLFVAGSFMPVGIAWGFHFLAFLPWYALALYVLCAAITLIAAIRFDVENFLKPIAGFMERRPAPFLGSVLILFVIGASIFHIPAPLLGDSFTLLKNFHDFDVGLSYLAPWNEPLSIFILYFLTSILGNSSFPAAVHSFFLVHLVFGCLFIVLCFFIVRELFTHPVQRLLVFWLVIVLPYMTFFMGYIEVYSVSSVAFALFVLCSVRSLKGKLSFIAVPISYALVTSSHVISGLLGISVLYLAIRDYRNGNRREVLAGFGIALFLMFILFLAVDFRIERLLDQSPISHFLSITWNITPVNAYSQAFTLFSLNHSIDLLNYFVLMSPFALLLLLAFIVRSGRKLFSANPVVVWGLLAIIPVFLYLIDAKLEQGTANDWDTFAVFFGLANLIAAVVVFAKYPAYGTKAVFLAAAMTLLNSITWFSVNAATEPSIRRFESLWDQRILSHLGRYTMSLREARYYSAIGDTLHQVSVWKEYSAAYPDDPRGYANTISAIDTLTPSDLEGTVQTYEKWFDIDPGNELIRIPYVNACLNLGDYYLSKDNTESASELYSRAIRLDSSSAPAHDRLGILHTRGRDFDKAINDFHQAIRIDTKRGATYYHLAELYLAMGRNDEYLATLRQAAGFGDTSAMHALHQSER
ncbi:MAG TPA: tetratricopeptide repeat protein [Bacteroidota bacterium]|nr:tetratricopeptide repeat protein [Bacteroidota bacterium]